MAENIAASTGICCLVCSVSPRHLDHTQQAHGQGTVRPDRRTSSPGSCHAAKLQI